MKRRLWNAALPRFMAGVLVIGGMSAAFGQIALTMQASEPNPVAGGIFFTYTLTATNTGPAGPMSVSDALPEGVEFISVSASGNALAASVICSGPPSGGNGFVVCSSPNFPAGGVATITIRAKVAANVTGLLDNIADALPVGPPFPERASFLQRVQTSATMIFQSTATPQVTAGDTVAYNLIAVDAGVSSILGVVIDDVLPDGTSFVSVTGTGPFHDACTFLPADNKVQCFSAEVPTAGGQITIVVQTDGKKTGSLVNTATLRAGSPLITNLQTSATTSVVKK